MCILFCCEFQLTLNIFVYFIFILLIEFLLLCYVISSYSLKKIALEVYIF